MNDLDDRLEQIKQRGNRLRQAQKKRRRIILTACVPVVLCICAVALWWQKPEPSRDTVGGTADAGNGMELLTAVITDKITCGDKVITEPDQVRQISQWVQTATTTIRHPQEAPESENAPTEGVTETSPTVDVEETPEDMDNYGVISDSSSHSLTFTLEENGMALTYTLTPTHLIDTQTGVQYPITRQQYEMFMEWML
jgi:hypothetical protein